MGSFVNKIMKKAVGVEKIFGTNKITGNIYDKYLGTDILGKKAAAEQQDKADLAANQAALNQQNNANILDANSAIDNTVQTDTGGSAAALDAAASDNKKKRSGSISTSLGF